jgi:hypothetical protein
MQENLERLTEFTASHRSYPDQVPKWNYERIILTGQNLSKSSLRYGILSNKTPGILKIFRFFFGFFFRIFFKFSSFEENLLFILDHVLWFQDFMTRATAVIHVVEFHGIAPAMGCSLNAGISQFSCFTKMRISTISWQTYDLNWIIFIFFLVWIDLLCWW